MQLFFDSGNNSYYVMLLPRLMSTGVVNKMEFLTGHGLYLLLFIGGYQFSTEMAEYWGKE